MSTPRPEAAKTAALAPRALRARTAAVVTGLAALALAVVSLPSLSEPWPVARELMRARATGYVACGALLGALAVTPLSTLLRSSGALAPVLPVLRRTLGMAAAWLALVHALAAFVGPLASRPSALLETSHLYAGMGALGILLLLLATSYARVVRALRLRTWKELHRLGYVASLLVVQHVALSPFADPRIVLALLALVVVLLLVRVVAAGSRAARGGTRNSSRSGSIQ